MFTKILDKGKKIILGFVGLLASGVASAAPLLDPLVFDPQIADVTSDITTAGTALIGLAIVAMSVRWVKATFF
ncbi:MAG TPA: hypothetical protein ENK59_07805 [Thioploca sp.]|nr:hypothetical protein [Thioploca sp.]